MAAGFVAGVILTTFMCGSNLQEAIYTDSDSYHLNVPSWSTDVSDAAESTRTEVDPFKQSVRAFIFMFIPSIVAHSLYSTLCTFLSPFLVSNQTPNYVHRRNAKTAGSNVRGFIFQPV